MARYMDSIPSKHSEPYLNNEGQAILDRHAGWWKREGSLFAEVEDAPLGDLWLPLADGTLAIDDATLVPCMLDIERLVGDQRAPGPLEFTGDAICVRSPYVRVPWVEAILGCPIQTTIKGGSMRTQAFIADWREWETSAPHRDNAWLHLLEQLTRLLAARSGGRYAVAQTLMRGPTDLAEAVLGPQLMCLSMFDNRRELRRFLEEVTDTFIEILRIQLDHIPKIQGGYVNSFGTWAAGTVARTQCDASVLLSPDQYAKWFLPYDQRICRSVDFSIIHLHSCSLHVVDTLLKVDYPKAIQITLETGPTVPSLTEMLPTFARILACKPLLLDGPLTGAQVDYLQNELPGNGLYIRARHSGW
jgi:hypothetical protein